MLHKRSFSVEERIVQFGLGGCHDVTDGHYDIGWTN